MAVPGEAACREVAPCGEGTWGDIPVEPNTQHVDPAYDIANGASDGSPSKPWIKIQEAIDAAEPGAIVALAEGNYDEALSILTKPVRLWGRCPALVEITAAGAPATIIVGYKKSNGTEIRDLALRGDSIAIVVTGAENVLIDRAWIHDAPGRGIQATNQLGITRLSVTRSLLEATHEFGVITAGATLTVDASVIRNTKPAPDGTFGRGVSAQADLDSGEPSNATIRASLLEHNHDNAAFVLGSTALLETSVIRDTQPSSDGIGRGLTARSDPDTKLRSNVTVRASTFERNTDVGLLIWGADALIETTSVRNTNPAADMTAGRGIDIERDAETGERANALIRSSLIEKNREFGVFVLGSDAVIESTLVRDTDLAPDGTTGAGGINIQIDPESLQRSTATVRSSAVLRSHEMGIFVSGSDATIEATLVQTTLPGVDMGFGRGINVQHHPGSQERGHAVIRSSLIDDSREMGVLFLGSDGSLENTRIQATHGRPSDGAFGDGVAVAVAGDHPAAITIDGALVEGSARAGVASFGAAIAIGSSMVECNSIALNGEELAGSPFAFEDKGGNACGCSGETAACKVLSAKLTPPTL